MVFGITVFGVKLPYMGQNAHYKMWGDPAVKGLRIEAYRWHQVEEWNIFLKQDGDLKGSGTGPTVLAAEQAVRQQLTQRIREAQDLLVWIGPGP